jgi:hypothetical protein
MMDKQSEIVMEENVTENVESQDSVIDYKAKYEEIQKQLESVAAHKDKLLNETKQAKRDREDARLAAEEAVKQKALKDGEFETLWKTTEAEKQELNKKLSDFVKSNRNEKLQIQSLKLSSELSDGDNVELLSEFITRKLDAMADDTGVLSAEVLEAVKQEYKNNAKYKSLLRSSKASGGGAPGQTNPVGEVSVIKRSDFEKMAPSNQMKFMKNRGVVTD